MKLFGIIFVFCLSIVSQKIIAQKVSQKKVTLITIVDKSGKNKSQHFEYNKVKGELPQIKDSSQNRVLIFNNGCSRTCTGSKGETGEWSKTSSGNFSCDGKAGPLVCPGRVAIKDPVNDTKN